MRRWTQKIKEWTDFVVKSLSFSGFEIFLTASDEMRKMLADNLEYSHNNEWYDC